ncbi:MAG TPA: diguanylate cyclase [Rhodocyclaceae bacterium]|nr:diguanylate cyclase [Rhodocyclaceae bacterium]
MKLKPSPTARVTLGILSLAVTVLLAFDMLLGVFPNAEQQELRARQHIAEGVSVQIAAMLSDDDEHHVASVIQELIKREPSLLSVGLRSIDGELPVASPGHSALWKTTQTKDIGRSRFVVPISAQPGRSTRWSQIELAFKPLAATQWRGMLFSPTVKLVLLFSLCAGGVFYLYLRRTFQHLDPTAAIPERVQMAFDAMSEAVLIINGEGKIVMANDAFQQLQPDRHDIVMGRDPAEFTWLQKSAGTESPQAPWIACVNTKTTVKGCAYEARSGENNVHRLIVNCSPILDARDVVRGCMVTFSDVTALEDANRRLVGLMTELSHSKEQLEVQNHELQRLANVDPMTGALNRRSFFAALENMFAEAGQRDLHLSFVMTDIDKFKSVNDIYGHQTGDKVIQKFAAILQRSVRDSDIVCRYGGEEFCIALPGTDVDQARAFAERLRFAVEAEVGLSLQLDPKPVITASFGISTFGAGATRPAELINQADVALYNSKHNGRNRCTIFSPNMDMREESGSNTAAA